MYPWLFWFWAPQFHYPLSGDVAQRIAPSWFFQGISEKSGNKTIEEKAFNKASYGTQLGLITEVLLEAVKESDLVSEKSRLSLKKLNDLRNVIEKLKVEEYEVMANTMAETLRKAKESGSENHGRMKSILMPQLE
ncbi:hypothetical protein [Teredinibacter haidensis]|uniref:hypothetical protein n=1 Tax=Teredinibacter haidensis TaxID=2731755 RepID=UPI000948FD11|nr:hypothetical protein [Teredinibacter haidensis]